MAGFYDKNQIKEQLTLENVYELFVDLGGDPEYAKHGLISSTICHNAPGEGSRKLYYYENSNLCQCFTGCIESSFDIFELIIKAKKIQFNEDWELYDAMCYVANFFGLEEAERPDARKNELEDWSVFKRHDFSISKQIEYPQLKEYDATILSRFLYPRILPWEKEGISKEINIEAQIGYYPSEDQITIPHFDIDNRLIGIRGRFLSSDKAELYGKYRPLYINKQLYNHPLAMNLYNINNSKDNIAKYHAAIIFESEKSCLMYRSYFGNDTDISVACCGSSVSNRQVDMLENLGAKEIVIAFDRQFQEIGDEEFIRLKNKLIGIYQKYGNRLRVTSIFDKNCILPYKASPIDVSKEIFEKLLNERIVPK